ncbi:MAG TPA: UDP-N-acetylmuramate dehydrogenase [Candidatus Polarisedimenticolia bacterium]|nr:UDP-N-acetylmuramate dehydrogenase [Candidatus Polarisedimenticolia bacterium]
MASRVGVDVIAKRCGVTAESGRTLAEFTTIGVGGPVAWVLKPTGLADLARLLADLKQEGYPVRVVGGGANLIAGPGPFYEPVILTRGIKHGPIFEGTRVRAGCGVVVKRLVGKCAEHGLAGLEFAEGIPGTVGGTVFMNAGSYGGQMSDVVREVTWLDMEGGTHRQAVAPTDFSYRRSPFQTGAVIVEAVFELAPGKREDLMTRLKEVSEKRSRSQPPGERSAGCVFKNPPGDSAGRLIDVSGLKGLAVGGAMVSPVHGNFIVNRGDATPEDVLRLIELIKQGVKERSGVTLEEEAIVWR